MGKIHTIYLIATLVLILTLLIGCSINSNKPVDETKIEKDIKSFHYQLQSTSFKDLKSLNVDFLIIDVDDSNLNSFQISVLKQTENGKKENMKILSYLSIGEAEDYRNYWKETWKVRNPDFIDLENPEWKGNYKVNYWDVVWQNITIERIKDIADLGYDGVYLDVVDAFEYYQNKGRDTAKQDMVEFVGTLSKAIKEIYPNFIIVSQSNPELYEEENFKNAIDGIGRESVWYQNDEKISEDNVNYVLDYMKITKNDGKLVFVIDYPTTNQNVCDFYSKCKEEEFYCLATNVALDRNIPITCH
ncbi:MAG: endo alpha-1,4 polygalactosaminidase [Candidatus Woesearchaeota archaeon]|jgi:cysteinyl-tRNA synthetase